MIPDYFIKYVSCCKLWLEFHKESNTSLLLRYKLTDSIYYKLLQDFNLISIRFNSLNSKEVLNENDMKIIEKEVIKYVDFFHVMSVIKYVMEN